MLSYYFRTDLCVNAFFFCPFDLSNQSWFQTNDQVEASSDVEEADGNENEAEAGSDEEEEEEEEDIEEGEQECIKAIEDLDAEEEEDVSISELNFLWHHLTL